MEAPMELKVDTEKDKEHMYDEVYNFVAAPTKCKKSVIKEAYLGNVTLGGVPVSPRTFGHYLSNLVMWGRLYVEVLPKNEAIYYTPAAWKEREKEIKVEKREREIRLSEEKRTRRTEAKALKDQQKTLRQKEKEQQLPLGLAPAVPIPSRFAPLTEPIPHPATHSELAELSERNKALIIENNKLLIEQNVAIIERNNELRATTEALQGFRSVIFFVTKDLEQSHFASPPSASKVKLCNGAHPVEEDDGSEEATDA
jgi:hypothetical protein